MMRRPLAFLVVSVAVAVPSHAADKIFDPTVLHDTQLVMDPADWAALRANFHSNQYYAANVAIDGDVLEQIGVRSRGQGSRDSTKPGVKLDFNKLARGQTFHGLKSVQVKNILQDPAMLRDYLAMTVFNAMGIPAPAVSYTRLTVNGEYWGLYNLVESVEEPFLVEHFGEKTGDLYKYEYTFAWDFSTRGPGANAYVPVPFKPEVPDSPDTSGLVALVQAVNEPSDAAFAGEIAASMDPREFVSYIAIENALAEYDGMLGNEGMNNFFVYQFAGTSRFIFIPWDKDSSFLQANWPIFQRVDDNVLARRLLADPTLRQTYLDTVVKAVTSYVNPAWLGTQLEAAYRLAREAALEDTKKPYSNDDFELAVEGLRGIIAARPADVMAQLPAGSSSHRQAWGSDR